VYGITTAPPERVTARSGQNQTADVIPHRYHPPRDR
jgi:hypothetical protein